MHACATPHYPYAEMERLGDEIAELSAHLDAATARLLDLIREFDANHGWNGFQSCAAWLSWRVGLDLGAARERVRVARALGSLPLLSQALARGGRALVRQGTRPHPRGHIRDRGAPARGRARRHRCPSGAYRAWLAPGGSPGRGEGDGKAARRALNIRYDEDGSVILSGRLEPEVGALLVQALAAARETLYQRARKTSQDVSAETSGTRESTTMAQRQADALALLAETALHHGMDPGTPGERYQIVVHVDAPVLADPGQPGQSVLEDGARVSAEPSKRLACDASRVVMRHDPDGRVVEIGARTRTIPPALRRALQHRDKDCRFPGCHSRFNEGHPIRHWAHGGPTALANLTLLCRRHHRAVHEEGYKVARGPDGELQFWGPDGRLLPDVPSSPAVPEKPVEALRARNDAHGLSLGPRTGCARYLGERLDLGWAIDVLHPLAVARES